MCRVDLEVELEVQPGLLALLALGGFHEFCTLGRCTPGAEGAPLRACWCERMVAERRGRYHWVGWCWPASGRSLGVREGGRHLLRAGQLAGLDSPGFCVCEELDVLQAQGTPGDHSVPEREGGGGGETLRRAGLVAAVP